VDPAALHYRVFIPVTVDTVREIEGTEIAHPAHFALTTDPWSRLGGRAARRPTPQPRRQLWPVSPAWEHWERRVSSTAR
jgi:hypothetical protein